MAITPDRDTRPSSERAGGGFPPFRTVRTEQVHCIKQNRFRSEQIYRRGKLNWPQPIRIRVSEVRWDIRDQTDRQTIIDQQYYRARGNSTVPKNTRVVGTGTCTGGSNTSSLTNLLPVLPNQIRSIRDVSFRFPCVMFWTITFPNNEILELLPFQVRETVV
jgi:hypothetical protein